MPSPAAAPLRVSPVQREVLEKVARSATAAHREVVRARVLLDSADGCANPGDRPVARGDRGDGAVLACRVRADGLANWGKVAKGRGRKASVSEEQVAEIVELTTKTKPAGATHWSTRTMAERAGVSKDTVRRIWNELGLQPHRVDTFKLSSDPAFTEKLIDVVGLYLDPPEKRRSCCAWTRSPRSRRAGPDPGLVADGAGPGRHDDP